MALANAAATALNQYVWSRQPDAVQPASATRSRSSSTILKDQQTDLEAQLTKPGANTDIINAQLDSVVNQYRLVYEQFQTLATNGAPDRGACPPLQAATPVQISGRAYDYRLSQNQNARGLRSTATRRPRRRPSTRPT